MQEDVKEVKRVFTVQNCQKDILYTFSTFGDAYDFIISMIEECFGDRSYSLQETNNIFTIPYCTYNSYIYEYTFNIGLITWTYYITSHLLVDERVFDKE